MEMYNQKKAIDTYYLDETNKNYNIDKLSSAVTLGMASITNSTQRAAYQAFLDKVNEKRATGVKLTQTEVDILNKEYELLQAQYALEEAQDAKKRAKNTMRLTRDSSGNYTYVYSADEDTAEDIEDKIQKVKDLENEIYNLHIQAADNASDAWL